MRVEELDTPAVVIDLDIMEHNIAKLAAYASAKNLNLRPHTKTHKIPEIAKMQISGGASGVTVAKPGEAQVMINEDVRDVMIAYPLVTVAKATAAARLANEAQLRVSVDSPEAVEALASAANNAASRIGVLVEIDTGFGRCGVGTPDEALSLARQIGRQTSLDFFGLMFYPGHLAKTPAEQPAAIAEVSATLERFYDAFSAARIHVPVVSGGSTPTAFNSHLFSGVTEIRPGMYLLNDANLVRMGVAELTDCALCVHVTIASNAVRDRVIIDGGSKTFSSDRSRSEPPTFGMILEDASASFIALSEEHGHIDISRTSRQFHVGERLRVLPNHVCTTVNMHDRIYGARNGVVERVWDVAGRGKVQ